MQPGKVYTEIMCSLSHISRFLDAQFEDRAVRETACSWLEVTTRSSSTTRLGSKSCSASAPKLTCSGGHIGRDGTVLICVGDVARLLSAGATARRCCPVATVRDCCLHGADDSGLPDIVPRDWDDG